MERIRRKPPFWLPGCYALLISNAGCSLHRVETCPSPNVCVAKEYRHEQGTVQPYRWWEEFASLDLNYWVESSLGRNLDLKQAWARLRQACAQVGISNAGKYPQYDLTLTASHSHTDGQTSSAFVGGSSTTYLVSNGLSYEIDLWRRIDSQSRSACHAAAASREDLEATALLLSGTVTELWLTIQEQRELYQLLQEQIHTNHTLLELVELRFSVGQSSALDVYQQRQQLAATEAQIPPVLANLETSFHQLRVLAGRDPQKEISPDEPARLPPLPPIARLGIPCDVLCRRPDIRAARHRVVSADYDVAAAIADRLPRLSISFDYNFSASSLGDLFEQETRTILGSLATPIIDGGRRRAEVERRRAITCERVYAFTESFLNALQEIEDSLSREKYQVDLLQRLDRQLEFANHNLREAQSRYTNGLDDYLSVITAIQSKQTLERRIVSERRNLLAFRGQLYRALGGTWTGDLTPCGLKGGLL